MQFLRSLVLATAVMIPASLQAGEIVVQGRGVVESAPDMAVVTIGARFQAHTAREALREVNARTAAAMEVMSKMGVEAKDMQTGDLYLNPLWDRGASHNEVARIRGYEAGNRITIRVRDLSVLGTALDEMVSDGANVFNGLQFALQDPSEALAEARRRAVQDAIDKATLYADAAGVSLGAILSINEGGIQTPKPMFQERAALAMDAAVPIAAGELQTSANVTIVYEIAGE
jgi:uncharacterized protein YggE